MLGHEVNNEKMLQKVLAKADLENYGHITFGQFKRIIAQQKHSKLLVNEEETLEAFIAMGGDPNGEGFVETSTLIRVLKNDFEMSIDIERLIADIDPGNTGRIGYDDFRLLLAQTGMVH